MKKKDFFDLNHAQNYLTGSLILLDGKPIIIEDVERREARFQIIYCELFSKIETQKYYIGENFIRTNKKEWLDNQSIDFNPVPLGFVNLLDEKNLYSCIYVARYPSIGYKIGLSEANIFRVPLIKDHIFSNNISDRLILRSCFIRDTIMGRFPSFRKAKKVVKESYTNQIAFSRKFAIFGDRLFYKGIEDNVGSFINRRVVLKDDFKFLVQVLEEDTRC